MDQLELRSVRLTGRAARYVYLLRDFGHLDEQGVDQLLLSIADGEGDGHGVLVDVGVVRRHAATMLFVDFSADDAGILADDWTMLFS